MIHLLRPGVLLVLFVAMEASVGCQPEEEEEDQPMDDGVPGCESPATQVSYREVGEAWGLQGSSGAVEEHHHGGSAAVDDLDGDGDLDMVLAFPGAPPVLYRRDGEGFVPEDLVGPATPHFLSLADVDGDGDIDILGGARQGPPAILIQEEGTFREMALPPLPEAAAERVREWAAGDLNGDGVVDLYGVVNSSSEDVGARQDFLLRGIGDGGFLLEEGSVPEESGKGFDARWLDVDGDFDQDLYLVQDQGHEYGTNRLFVNDAGELRDGNAGCGCETPMSGMGVDVADINGDTLPDLYLSASVHSVLLESVAVQLWVDATASRGVDSLEGGSDMAWGAVWFDQENDGDLDILVAEGDLWDEEEPELPHFEAPISLMIQGEDGRFDEVGRDFGLAQEGSHRAVVAADHNGDGVVDLLVTEVFKPPRLYLSEGCTAASWIEVDAPDGSLIVVRAGGKIQRGWSTHESACGAARPRLVHFGLGEADEVEEIRVTLLGGREVVMNGPISVRQKVRLGW